MYIKEIAMNYKLVTLGDIHWDASNMSPIRLEKEFNEVIFPWLESNHFDAFIQLGDWFDKRISLDSDSSKIAMRVLVRLCKLCQDRNVPFRIIKGTLSHDYSQLLNYIPLETEFSCFRIINTAGHEELLPGFDILWMPEEYPTDYDDFYNQFLFTEEGDSLIYDGIFGHGEIDVAANWSSANEGERHYGGTPCHKASMLLEHCSGPVWFGHVHKRFRYKKRLGYPGTFTRWIYGEEETKGFDVLDIQYSEKAEAWVVKDTIIENPLAPEFNTVTLPEILNGTESVDEILVKIRACVGAAHKLRVKVEDFPLGVEELSLIRGSLINDRNIDLMSVARAVNNTAINEATEDDTADTTATSERATRLAYLRDVSIPGEERLLRYLHETYPERADVSIDDVRELTAPL
jgi:DNA repair exonuclease SbcCD nuclease subunit